MRFVFKGILACGLSMFAFTVAGRPANASTTGSTSGSFDQKPTPSPTPTPTPKAVHTYIAVPVPSPQKPKASVPPTPTPTPIIKPMNITIAPTPAPQKAKPSPSPTPAPVPPPKPLNITIGPPLPHSKSTPTPNPAPGQGTIGIPVGLPQNPKSGPMNAPGPVATPVPVHVGGHGLPPQQIGPSVPVSTSPSSLNFGELYSGESRSLSAKIVPGSDGRDGDATISLEGISPSPGRGPNPVFKIVEVQSWGLNVAPPAPTTKNPGVVRGPAISSSSNQKGPAGGSGIPLNGEQPHLIQSVTRPPFKLHLKPGDQLIVKMDAAPLLDLINGPAAGNYSAHIQAQGSGWTANIPVTQNFHGLRLGIMATLAANEDSVYYPESYVPGQSYPAPLNITLINSEKIAQHVKINATQLPRGFSLPVQAVDIPAGQTAKLALPFAVKWGVGAGAIGPSQKAQLEIASEAGKKLLPFVFTVKPSLKRYEFRGSDGADWSASYTIHRDGTFDFSYAVVNDNLAVNRDFQFAGTWNGHKVIGIAGRAKRNSTTTDHYGFKSGFVEQNFDLMLEKSPDLKASIKNSL